jgi:drug/metabolite transporter (DMT)-like permease
MTPIPPTHGVQHRLLTNVPMIMAILLLVDSLHFVFARLLRPYLPGEAAAFYVLAVATAETGVIFGLWGRIRWTVWRLHLVFFAVTGFLVASSTALNYVAVSYVDPGTASLLAQTSTIFALILGLIWLREPFTRPQMMGALLAVAGVFIINYQPVSLLRLGSLLVLTSAFCYALHAAVVKRDGGGLPFESFFFFRVASTAFFLLLFTTGRGKLVWPGWDAWPLLVVAGSVDVVFSRILYYLALRRLNLSLHTVILNLSPVITILWSIALFNERPSLQSLAGGSAVIGGVILATRYRRRRA